MSEVVKAEMAQNGRTPFLFAQAEDKHPDSRLFKRAKSSLNGIFINGRRLAHGSYEFLSPGYKAGTLCLLFLHFLDRTIAFSEVCSPQIHSLIICAGNIWESWYLWTVGRIV